MAENVEPPRREIREPRDAELAARDWMRWIGHDDAELTQGGADGGIDVRATGVVAQVKAEAAPVGRPAIQQLYGVAQVEGAKALFFAWGGYTDGAVRWAERAGVALFSLNMIGEVEPIGDAAADVADPHKGEPPAFDAWQATARAFGESVGLGDDDDDRCRDNSAELPDDLRFSSTAALRPAMTRADEGDASLSTWDEDGEAYGRDRILEWLNGAMRESPGVASSLSLSHSDRHTTVAGQAGACSIQFFVEIPISATFGTQRQCISFTSAGFGLSDIEASGVAIAVGRYADSAPNSVFHVPHEAIGLFDAWTVYWDRGPEELVEVIETIAREAGRSLDDSQWHLEDETISHWLSGIRAPIESTSSYEDTSQVYDRAAVERWLVRATRSPDGASHSLSVFHRDQSRSGHIESRGCIVQFFAPLNVGDAVEVTLLEFSEDDIEAGYEALGVEPGGFPLDNPANVLAEVDNRGRVSDWDMSWEGDPLTLLELVSASTRHAGQPLDDGRWYGTTE